MNPSLTKASRRALRRATRIACHAVQDARFELLGERALDVSPRGMLVACDSQAELGDAVIVSFLTPGIEPVWLDAEAEVVRIVHGLREHDPGYCAGLRFTYFERSAQDELLSRLAGLPPPVPRRRALSSRARGRAAWAADQGVLVRPIVRVSPAHGRFPAGVFSA